MSVDDLAPLLSVPGVEPACDAPPDDTARRDAERFVAALYHGILNREPSADEIAAWAAPLTLDQTDVVGYVADMAATFLTSEERQRIDAERAAPPPEPEPIPTTAPLFAPAGHFYSPVVDVSEAERHLARLAAQPLPETLPGLRLDRARMVSAWQDLLPHLLAVPLPDQPTPGFRYCYDNPAYSYGDGATLYALIRRHRPQRIIEIGCGWSSACLLDAIDRELAGACEVTFVEPYPDLLYRLAGTPWPGHRVINSGIQDVPLEEFERLEANDILFIDSTHVVKTGSDVVYELLDILPRLKTGVLVHIHDIFWPFEYPSDWVVQQNRSWNELYALRAFLAHNTAWDIEFFGNYLTQMEATRVRRDFPRMIRNAGGAIWLRRIA
ncbi:class I SAM-dependent methyltransferase [Ancylobacter radicis]|uniref:Class I SAM-dependent methyltransferase n=1 Tax=Ancylobacter radicis TaxID=2836179 RepID=A0ABS5R4G9_9HYPH|nr:class I SAM-dependent methyltransferase [Ancylobacter radicis]MBS9476544.1 class I SAM-dependent methyltransferase [Ancylobacter radicis]